MDTGGYEDWTAAGAKTLAQRAGERVDQILAQHQPEPLAADVHRRIDQVVERATH
jgi:trimethylamine:corrinoid methyltransferase-like protein